MRSRTTSFDFINTEQVFEHLVDPYETLVHLTRSLTPGGLLTISVPPSNDIRRRLEANDWKAAKSTLNSLNAVAPLEHLNCYHGRAWSRWPSGQGWRRHTSPPAPTTNSCP